MHKVISVFCLLSIAASLMAAPTANEDFVVAEDAKTYTNAVDAAKEYTDEKIGAIDVGVTSVNGSTGAVRIGAADVGAVPTSRKINGQPLTSDITIAGGVTSVNGSTGAVTIDAADVGAVPTSRKVNGKALTGDVSLVPADIGAIASGVNKGVGFTLAANPRLLGGSSIMFSNSSIEKSYPSGSADVSEIGFDAWNWLLVGDIGLGNYLGYALGNAGKVSSVNGKTGDVVLDAADVGAFGAEAGSSLQSQVATIGAHLNAEDARFVVTNYNSATHMPEAYVEIKLPDNSWSRIWSEMTRWNWLTGTYLTGNFYTQTSIDAKLAEKADRAWGFYDSTTGAYAPVDYTWISSPKIAIAANLAYQRTVTAEGAIWVLESNGTVTETGGMTNGFFRISDDEGNSLFEIVKGKKRTVGADASSCQTVAGFTPTKLQIGYSIVSDVHPKIYVCNSLSTQAWKAEDDADCVANVSWSGASGAWVAQVQGKSAYSSLFVKATYEVGGETYISNSAPVSMQYLMLGGVKYAVGTATISGHTVLTLTVAP